MKKILFFAFLAVLPVLLISPVLANGPASVAQKSPPPVKDIGGWLGIVSIVARWLYTILLVVAVIFGLLAAFTYLTAAGDPAKVKKASSQLIYAVVAIVVAILAFSISKIVTSIMGVTVDID